MVKQMQSSSMSPEGAGPGPGSAGGAGGSVSGCAGSPAAPAAASIPRRRVSETSATPEAVTPAPAATGPGGPAPATPSGASAGNAAASGGPPGAGGRPGVVLFDNARDFDAVCAALRDAIKPADAVEEMFVDDVAGHYWDGARARRAATLALNGEVERLSLEAYLKGRPTGRDPASGSVDWNEARAIAADGSREFRALLDTGTLIEQVPFVRALERQGLTPADISHRAYLNTLEETQKLKRIAFDADRQRIALLREIARHRASLAGQLRHVLAEPAWTASGEGPRDQ